MTMEVPCPRHYTLLDKAEWERARAYRWFCCTVEDGRVTLGDVYKKPSTIKKDAWMSILGDTVDLCNCGCKILVRPSIIWHTFHKFTAGYVFRTADNSTWYREYASNGYFEYAIETAYDRMWLKKFVRR